MKRLLKSAQYSRHNPLNLLKNIVIFLLLLIIVWLYRLNSRSAYSAPPPKSSAHHVGSSFFDGDDPNPDRIRIDWHDYKLMEREARRKGLGEHGVKATIDGDSERQRVLYAANGYDGYLSDLISVNRSVPDVRPLGCKSRRYLSNLPTVSAIIPVYNEHFSIVMRTAHSIMNRAQGDLVREVIFVNDQSEPKFLNSSFDEYVAENFKGRGRVIHLKERVGLIQARMAGARIATGDVLLFADAHTEATINYLPPMLDPIAENYRVVTIPIEDALDVHNFEYPQPEVNTRAIFDWNLNYWTVPVPLHNARDPSKPYRAPLMKGGIFAISAKFFWELDGYDDQLEIWGGEQYEISFKVWMCGGAMYQIPCSHFGHMFRSDGRPFKNPKPYNYITRNYKRVIEVWMDEYKEYIYMRDPVSWSIDAGLLLRQHAVREKLKCKSFEWYLKNVAPEILEKYPVLGWPWYAKGWIRSMKMNSHCVTITDTDIGLYPCEGNATLPSWGQRFELSYFKDIAQYNIQQFDCLEPESNTRHSRLVKAECTQKQGAQLWKYNPKTHMLHHDLQGKYCMEGDPLRSKVFLNRCNPSNENQKWKWGRVNRTMLANWETTGTKLL